MSNNRGTAIWQGGLKEGIGTVESHGPALRASYNFASRFGEDNTGTNPEELIGAAHAACYSMFLASLLEKAGHNPVEVRTEVTVSLSRDDRGPFINKLQIVTEANVPSVGEEEFQKIAQQAKENCPISRALGAVNEMTLKASITAE